VFLTPASCSVRSDQDFSSFSSLSGHVNPAGVSSLSDYSFCRRCTTFDTIRMYLIPQFSPFFFLYFKVKPTVDDVRLVLFVTTISCSGFI